LLILLFVIGWDCYVQFAELEHRANAATDLLLIFLIGFIGLILAREFNL
jgi:hypothetical protein